MDRLKNFDWAVYLDNSKHEAYELVTFRHLIKNLGWKWVSSKPLQGIGAQEFHCYMGAFYEHESGLGIITSYLPEELPSGIKVIFELPDQRDEAIQYASQKALKV